MSANTKDLSGKGACSCTGSPTANDNRSLASRFWRAVKAWENAMDYSGADYLLERLHALEKDVSILKAELENRRSPVS